MPVRTDRWGIGKMEEKWTNVSRVIALLSKQLKGAIGHTRP